MVDLNALRAEDLKALGPDAITEVATRMLAQLAAQARQIEQQQALVARRDAEIRFKDAKLEKLTFELARHKAWKFGAKTERMSAAQRQMFEDTAAEDEADLQAQIDALKAASAQAQPTAEPTETPKRAPRRQKLAEHLRRIEHRHEPADTTCGCGAPMQRVGEDVSERLDIIPAEFIVHRHIRGKWACRSFVVWRC